MFAPSNFLNLDQTEHRTIFDNSTQVWDVLKQIGSYLQFRLKPAVYARVMGRPFISENVYIGAGTVSRTEPPLKALPGSGTTAKYGAAVIYAKTSSSATGWCSAIRANSKIALSSMTPTYLTSVMSAIPCWVIKSISAPASSSPMSDWIAKRSA